MKVRRKNILRILAAAVALVLVLVCGVAVSTNASAEAAQSPAVSAEPKAVSDISVSKDDGRPVIRVGTVDELLAAIASDTVIELKEGTYSLPEAKNYGRESGNPDYLWNEAYDGWELEIRNIRNLTLRGAGIGYPKSYSARCGHRENRNQHRSALCKCHLLQRMPEY